MEFGEEEVLSMVFCGRLESGIKMMVWMLVLETGEMVV